MHNLAVALLMVLISNQVLGKEQEDEIKLRKLRSLMDAGGVVTKFRKGLNMAGRMLGLDTAAGVANLVSTSLLASKPQWVRQDQQPASGVFSAFFRLLGLDSTKLGAIALNAIIFIAQLIGNTLMEPKPEEETRSKDGKMGNPLTWILDNPSQKIATLLEVAQDRTLPEKLARRLPGRHTGCVQLLVCKSAPFVWGMQRSLRALLQPDPASQAEWSLLGPLQRMYAYIPSVSEVTSHGDQCEVNYPDCKLLSF
ncbi:uncharacterized protein [Anabrus simplex]|uniref:uncharacterized protein n=1 Tax=Anabrus simplex TaxID=316456 RepID=UPI0035A382EE